MSEASLPRAGEIVNYARQHPEATIPATLGRFLINPKFVPVIEKMLSDADRGA